MDKHSIKNGAGSNNTRIYSYAYRRNLKTKEQIEAATKLYNISLVLTERAIPIKSNSINIAMNKAMKKIVMINVI